MSKAYIIIAGRESLLLLHAAIAPTTFVSFSTMCCTFNGPELVVKVQLELFRGKVVEVTVARDTGGQTILPPC